MSLTTKQIAEAMARHAAIVGTVGSGKTFAAKGIVEDIVGAGRRVCVLDPTGVWWGMRSSADGKKAGLPFAIFGGDHADVPINEHSGEAVAKVIATRNLPAIIDLSGMMLGERQRFMLDFAQHLFALNKAPLHLVIDEADEFAPQNPMAEQKRMLHHVDRIVRRGRSRGFRVILISQRPAVLHKNVLTQIATLVAMKLTSPQDRKALQAWVEGNADEGEAAKVMKSLASLPIGEGWVWSPGAGILERHKFPRIKTFDSSRTPDDDETIEEPTKLADVDVSEIRATFEKETDEDERPARGGVTEAEVQRRVALMRDQVSAEACANMIPKTTAANEVGAVLEVFDRCVSQIRIAMEKVMEDFGQVGLRIDPMVRKDFEREVRSHLRTAPPPGRYEPWPPLPQGERAILTAIAQAGGVAERAQLMVLTGYKRSSLNTYLQKLASRRYVEQSGSGICATRDGLSALGDYERLPTGRALFEHWRGKLPEGERRVLEAVYGSRGKPVQVERNAIDKVTGYKVSSRNTYLQKLIARKLIETSGSFVHAASALYD